MPPKVNGIVTDAAVTGDPRFLDPSGSSGASGYRTGAGSAAMDRGRSYQTVPID